MSNDTNYYGLYTGFVVNADDPQQNDRLQVSCELLGDDLTSIGALPWCRRLTSDGGTVMQEEYTRGADQYKTKGSVAYGIRGSLPPIGTEVGVMCIGGNPTRRVWCGTVLGHNEQNTIPHGRFYHKRTSADGKSAPDGPFSNLGYPIQPLYDNLATAFNHIKTAPEWITRASDRIAGAVLSEWLDPTDPQTKQQGDEIDPKTKMPYGGYRPNRWHNAKAQRNILTKQVESWTSKGFHSISMDDSIDNCRLRIRTTSGHQIILDDTNERIYVSTMEGNNWFEMDRAGNVDGFTSRKLSWHAQGDINFTTDSTFRVHAAKGIDLFSDDHFALQSKTNFSINSSSNIYLYSSVNTEIYAKVSVNINSIQSTSINSSMATIINAGATVSLMSASVILSGMLSFNEAPGLPALIPQMTSGVISLWSNRVPDHEPWGRSGMVNPGSNTSWTPEFISGDADCNKSEDGQSLNRGPYWKA